MPLSQHQLEWGGFTVSFEESQPKLLRRNLNYENSNLTISPKLLPTKTGLTMMQMGQVKVQVNKEFKIMG
jgi:hypothetical protein